MSIGTLLFLRLVHIVLGVFWVGAVVFIALFLMPSVRAAGPAGGAVMQQIIQTRRLGVWLMAAGVLTVLSGIGLYWHDSAGFTSTAWLGSRQGRVFGLGGILAISAMIVGMAVSSPTGRKLGEMGAQVQASGRPPTPDQAATIQRLQERLGRSTMAVATLLVLAAAAMAVARYA
jgi:uncharacterized membrane protein